MEADESPGLLIGQVASLAGVTVKTVRHYEKLGLVEHSRRESNGYKRYDGDAVVRVACVAALRRAGLPLARVAAVLDHAPSAAESVRGVLDVLRSERDRIEEQLLALESLAAAIADGEGPLEELGRPFVGAMKEALGEEAPDIDDEVWRIERRVAGLFASFGLVVDELPERAREYIRVHAEEVGAAIEADAALAGLREVAADDPLVDEVAALLQRARPTAMALAGLVEVPKGTQAEVQAIVRPKLSGAQREALRRASSIS